MSWSYDKSAKVWKCTSYTDLDDVTINNFAEHGQPFSPGPPLDSRFLDEEHYIDPESIVIEMPHHEIMTNGYGRNIEASSFPVVKRFLNEKLSIPFGTYSFDELVCLGFTTAGDRRITGKLYWCLLTNLASVPLPDRLEHLIRGSADFCGSADAGTAAYIHGTVGTSLMRSTKFTYESTLRSVDAEIGASDDNFDFESDTIGGRLEIIVAIVMGPDRFNYVSPPGEVVYDKRLEQFNFDSKRIPDEVKFEVGEILHRDSSPSISGTGEVITKHRRIEILFRGPGRLSRAAKTWYPPQQDASASAQAAEAAKEISIRFGAIRDHRFWGRDAIATGTLWDYMYDFGKVQYHGRISPIPGPGCQVTSYVPGCFSAPTGIDGSEGVTPWDHVTLRPASDTFIYLDVGFWGGSRRDFGLICGPEVWLCRYGAPGGAPSGDDRGVPFNKLREFYEHIRNFTVVQHATSSHTDGYENSTDIQLILPSMNMWPDPKGMSANCFDFVQPRSFEESPFSQLAAFRHITDVERMLGEEKQRGFGGAGAQLACLLEKVQAASQAGFTIYVVQLGDLFDMWSPEPALIDALPVDGAEMLRITETAEDNLPRFLELAYLNPQNRRALDLLLAPEMRCHHVYGNRDIYLATQWRSTGIDIIDGLQGTEAWYHRNLAWMEHGHRFHAAGSDGYWLANQTLDTVATMGRTSGASPITIRLIRPGLRKLEDSPGDPEQILYGRSIPHASLWYVLAHHAQITNSKGKKEFFEPPPFRIFCQAHSHVPALLQVHVVWPAVKGAVE